MCPACGGQLGHWREVAASDPALGARRFTLLRCAVCGTAVTSGDAPARLHETGAYRSGAPRLHAVARPALWMFDRQRLAMLRQLAPPPARLLDIGAGRGRFVASARAAGYDASGIEPSARGAQAARERGLPVTRVSLEEAEIRAGSIDAATLWHVLEHLEDPRSALERIHGWLRPGGTLLVGVPNLASLQARLRVEHWFHLDVPRHRTHFTQSGLHKLLTRAGFEPQKTHHLLLEHNPFGMWQSLVNRLTAHPSYLYNLLKRNAPARSPDLAITLAALPLAPLAAMAEALAGAARKGGTIAVLARSEG